MMSGAIYNDFSQFTTLRAEATKNPNAALEDVAAQFESIFLQQMLKSMRDATVKSGLFESSQMETCRAWRTNNSRFSSQSRAVSAWLNDGRAIRPAV